ncbi:hypothetical protein Dtox_3394 [Desulfofarcimen acetoxidans DSM 771]|uniref:Uncharacterized protein n=1 Tax=Desulfofarcimen acetoxidans (strain ATCC 49208 / DSM 771 / KCTC 5769 / VKM B-1644 / 5575) TaxID=485916 RepID=C8W6L1_DESAS|nr:hypothetical protein Dtox_3394 [Desulfofarcimen acetoxidans DSM 771]
MVRKAIYITIALIIASTMLFYLSQFRFNMIWGKPVGIVEDLKSMVVKYDPNVSSTFKKPYNKLKNELLYARLTNTVEGQTEHTIIIIRNKDCLINIVREFDKLKSTVPQEYNPAEYKLSDFKFYNLTIWREGKSVTYVFGQNDSDYYEGSTAWRTKNGNMVLRKMPEKLIRLIMEPSTKK